MCPARYAIVFCLAWLSGSVFAQSSVTGASLSGTVHDPSGALVAGAEVLAISKASGQHWAARTGESGRFRLPSLPAGDYRLEVAAAGFQKSVTQLSLLLGQAFELSITVAVGSTTQQVDVTSETPAVDTVRTQASEAVSPREVADLPSNGRNYLDLALLAPNVSRTNTGTVQRFAETSAVPGTGISIGSQRNLNNTLIVDGLSANDDAAELAGTFYSQEVVREFQVVTSGIAEFGRASGGVINIVTRSGGNRRHGGAYGFLRNQRLDAANPLSRTRLPLTQAQYGGTLGGPIRAGKSFYFGNFEQSRQNTTGIVTITPENVAAINHRLDTTDYRGPRLTAGPFPSTLDTTTLFGKVDHRWNDRLESAFRYSFYDVASINARTAGGLNAVSRGSGLANQDQTIAANTLWTLSPTALYEARAQFTRSRLEAPVNDATGPAVNIAGVASFGTAAFSPTARNIDLWQVVSTFSKQHRQHSFKGGADVLHNRVTIAFPGAMQGVYTFASMPDFLAGRYVNFQQAFGQPSTTLNNPNLGLFLEDEWSLHPGLTLNVGLRYDLQGLPTPVKTDTNNLAPRLGFAWDPLGTGKTVVRASYGMFYDRLPLRAVANALQRDGINYAVALLTPGAAAAPVFPNILSAFPAGILTSITSMDPHIQNSYAHQASLQVSRELGAGTSLELGYLHLRGTALIMARNVNVPTTRDPAVFNLGRPDPRWANNSQYQSIGDSWYDGMTVSLKRSVGRATFRVSYTLSKALDTAGNFFFSMPQDNFHIAAEKGRSDNDQRHRIALSGIFASSQGNRRLLDVFTHGWLLSYVFSYTSALPFNVQTGTDRNGDTNPNDRPAGMGRNTGQAFDYYALDLRLSRTFPVGERLRLEVIGDGFNVLNHRNDMLPNNIFGPGTTPRPGFGAPSAVGDPRELQLGLRLSF